MNMKDMNGVDVGAVEEAMGNIENQPDLAKFRFRICNNWISGGRNRTDITGFYGAGTENRHQQPFHLESDEPPLLAGSDQAPSPVEHLLNALASCLTSTLVYHAALRGIKIDALESELSGDLDLRGFLGISNDVRRGYQKIQVDFKVRTAAENLERLKALSKLSPVFDVVSNGTQVEVNISRAG